MANIMRPRRRPVPYSLFPTPYSLLFYLRSHKSADTNARNTIAITPFMVKNAAFRRRRSRGETMACS